MVNGVRNMLVVTEKGLSAVSDCTFTFAIHARAFQPGIAVLPLNLPHAQAIASSDRESNAKNANGCKICSIFPPTTSLLYANRQRIIPCQNDRREEKALVRRVAENSQRGAVSLILSWRFSISLSMTERHICVMTLSTKRNYKRKWSDPKWSVVFHCNSCCNTLVPKFFHNSSWFEQEPMLLVWDIIGPGRCIENKGGTGQIIDCEPQTKKIAIFRSERSDDRKCVCCSQASQIRVFVEMRAFYTWPGAWFAITSGYGLWNTPLPTSPGTPSTCSPHLRYSRLPPLEPPANSKQFLFPFRTFSISEFYPR